MMHRSLTGAFFAGLISCGALEADRPSSVLNLGGDVGQLAPPGTLEVAIDGSIAGASMTFTVSGAAAGATVGVGMSRRGVGAGPCFDVLGGLCLNLKTPVRRMFFAEADDSGEAVVSVAIPDSAAGVSACFQAVEQGLTDPSFSATSDVLCRTIMAPSTDCPTDDRDCAAVCGGSAEIDDCGRCVGGTTGLEAATEDRDRDGIPDVCDRCTEDGGRRFVVQWTTVEHYDAGGGPYTFQLVLHESGEFAYYYKEMEDFALSATIGWQTAAGEDFASLGHHTLYPLDYSAVTFVVGGSSFPAVEYVNPMEWNDVRTTGEPLGLGDDTELAVDIGFDFPFMGEAYPEVRVNSNGVVTLTGAMPGYADLAIPVEGLGDNLFVLWDDFNPASTGAGEVFIQSIEEGCEMDCAGFMGGTAELDSCGECYGGETMMAADRNLDCAGVCGGEAFRDDCGDCVGGTTGLDPVSVEDCETGVDLIVDQPALAGDVYIDYVDVGDDSCLVAEGCVQDIGVRRVLRFATMVANIGVEDLMLGTPGEDDHTDHDDHTGTDHDDHTGTDHDDHGDSPWHWDDCHGHYHYDAYAQYDLRDLATGEILPIGAKTGFCVMDLGIYDEEISGGDCTWYNCSDQGISAGCFDIYGSSLQCQWIDITDIGDGLYELIVTTNPDGEVDETDLTNNSASVVVSIVGDDVTVVE